MASLPCMQGVQKALKNWIRAFAGRTQDDSCKRLLGQKCSHNDSCLIFALQGCIEESAGLAETRALQLEKCLFALQGEASASIYVHSTRRKESASQEKFRTQSWAFQGFDMGGSRRGRSPLFRNYLKTRLPATPANPGGGAAGVQNLAKNLDSGVRRNDDRRRLSHLEIVS